MRLFLRPLFCALLSPAVLLSLVDATVYSCVVISDTAAIVDGRYVIPHFCPHNCPKHTGRICARKDKEMKREKETDEFGNNLPRQQSTETLNLEEDRQESGGKKRRIARVPCLCKRKREARSQVGADARHRTRLKLIPGISFPGISREEAERSKAKVRVNL